MENVLNGESGAKPAPREVHAKLKSFGVSDLDAGLVADCLNVGKSTTWMNNDPVSDDAGDKIKAFLNEHGYEFEITITPARYGKFIWDVKKNYRE